MIYKSIAVVFYFANIVSGSAPTEKLVFYETFDTDPFDTTWFKSLDQKYKDQPIMIAPASNPILGFEEDKGLKLTQEMKYYAFGAKFAQPLETKLNTDDVVIQYEVKLEEGLACGGAYVKLPRATPDLDMTLINNDTPYSIMFGPDKCGNNNKVHFILQFQNPITLEWEEKHFNETISVKNDKKVHLYTLVLSADNSFDILVDSHSAKKGNLLTHMVPPINPPLTIPDTADSKPLTWVDAAEIEDPSVEKPADWDEEAPRKIPDLKAVKPVGWADDAPEKISDPEAQKPGDWDDEEVSYQRPNLLLNSQYSLSGR
jgi:calnexin